MRGIYFYCPQCHQPVPADSIVRTDKDQIYIMATCEPCAEEFRFEIENLIKQLFTERIPYNGRPN